MNVLLDTHVLLWSIFDPTRLSKTAKRILEDSENEAQVSAVSFLEISLKYQIGKLDLKGCIPEDLLLPAQEMGFSVAEIKADLLLSSYRLPLETHRDPFDRLLAWHALHLDASLITRDASFHEYAAHGLKTIW